MVNKPKREVLRASFNNALSLVIKKSAWAVCAKTKNF
jgi:hypothetical protein